HVERRWPSTSATHQQSQLRWNLATASPRYSEPQAWLRGEQGHAGPAQPRQVDFEVL
ncbi:hypothetical protein LTR53_015954, partial [Teratosphaeriaceae sp. CCFEE 6253]